MSTSNLDQAREWAEKYQRHHVIGPENEIAAVEVIRGLPNIVVDGEEIITIYDKYRDDAITLHEAFHAVVALAIPPLPTLADMTSEELEACQWMQAEHTQIGRICITQIEPTGQTIMNQNGAAAWSALADRKNITPLPDEPKWEWPAKEPHLDKDSLSGMWTDDGSSPSDAIESLLDKYEDHDLPRPEDVPPGEPWSVRYWGKEWVGVRSDNEIEPWSITSMDGMDYRDVDDSEITLMFRLVPETP